MIEITYDRKSTYRALKKQTIVDLERDLADPKVSAAYKKSVTRYVVRELADMNEVLELDARDGVKEEWLKI